MESMLPCDIQMPIPQSMIARCKRCTHEWIKRSDRKPKRCPNCKSPYWDIPPGKLPMGRPKKAATKGEK